MGGSPLSIAATAGHGMPFGSMPVSPRSPCLTRSISANHFLYDGQYQDNISGLYYLRARWYDPATGQFTSIDALVALTGQPYSYAGNNPVNGSDLLGLFVLQLGDIGNWPLSMSNSRFPINSFLNIFGLTAQMSIYGGAFTPSSLAGYAVQQSFSKYSSAIKSAINALLLVTGLQVASMELTGAAQANYVYDYVFGTTPFSIHQNMVALQLTLELKICSFLGFCFHASQTIQVQLFNGWQAYYYFKPVAFNWGWITALDFAEYQAGELAYQEGYTNSDFYESNGIGLC